MKIFKMQTSSSVIVKFQYLAPHMLTFYPLMQSLNCVIVHQPSSKTKYWQHFQFNSIWQCGKLLNMIHIYALLSLFYGQVNIPAIMQHHTSCVNPLDYLWPKTCSSLLFKFLSPILNPLKTIWFCYNIHAFPLDPAEYTRDYCLQRINVLILN